MLGREKTQLCTPHLTLTLYSHQWTEFIARATATPFNLLFLDRFDGNGNIQGIKGATSTGGEVAQDLSDTSTYQVNSDCTVTLSFQNQKFKYFGVIVNNGKKVLILETDSGTNISGVLEKVNH